MKLKSFGCSFIFGSDLLDPTHAWPSQVSQRLGLEYQCHAMPGIGNLQIANKVLEQLDLSDNDFFVIGWTWIDRFDYTGADDNRWSTIMPGDTTAQAAHYYRDLHSEYRDKLTNLITIRCVVDQLTAANIPFLMTYMDELLFDQRWHLNATVKTLQDSLKPLMTTFEGLTFLDWSRSNGFAESEKWHPLEQAHSVASDYIIKILEKSYPNLQGKVD